MLAICGLEKGQFERVVLYLLRPLLIAHGPAREQFERDSMRNRCGVLFGAALLVFLCWGCAGITSGTSKPASTATVPSIATEPSSQTVTVGQSATFTVAATGSAPLAYQWEKNGTAITGATSSSYTTAATSSSDNGAQFRVVVSNSVGTTTSTAASLTVSAAAI